MSSEIYNLAILLTVKDAASGGLDRFSANIHRSTSNAGKDINALERNFEKLRKELNKGLAIGGAGLAGLAMIGKGVQVAGDFQASMTDLRTTLSQVGKDGSVNLNQLGKDMLKAEAIAMRMGNLLPGSTEDFVQAIQVLKQNGLETETILNGAAEAVGNLAVANNALPKDVAKDFAQFGQLFKLKPDEYLKAADVFSKLYTSSGIATDELIQAAKYFQGRSGAAIGLTGLKDAQESIRLIGLLRKQGLEGSEAGTALNNLFSGYISHADALKSLEKDKGIKLKFFDEKGSFAGIDNLFKQLEPLNKLTEEERVIRLKAIFGEEGMSAATAILKTGADGWRSYNAEQEKTISLQAKNAEKAKDFNNQMEALTGSVKNLVVTGFEPLLPMATGGVNSVNQLVGSIQGFAKENAGLTKTVAMIALYGTTAMTVVGGFTAMTSAWRIWRAVSAFSNSDGLLTYLNRTKIALTETQGAATKLANARASGFKGDMTAWLRHLDEENAKVTGLTKKVSTFQRIASSPITMVLGVAAAELAITSLIQHFNEIDERIEKVAENAKTISQTYDRLSGLGLLYNAPGDYKNKKGEDSKGEFDSIAKQFIETIKEGRTLETSLHPERAGWWEHYKNLAELPYGSYTGGGQFNPTVAANRWMSQGSTAGLHDPNALARVLVQLQKSEDLKLNLDDIKLLELSLQKIVGKDTFNTASGIAKKDLYGEKPLATPTKSFNQLFNPLGQPSLFPQPKSQFNNLLQQPSEGGFKLPPVIDFNKPISEITTNLSGLSQPIAGTTQMFGGLQTAGGDWQTSILRIAESSNTGAEDLTNFGSSLLKTESPLNRILTSANSASNGLNLLSDKLANWQPPIPNVQTINIGVPAGTPNNTTVGIPPNAVGGVVERDGVAYVHSGNVIVPARVLRTFGTGTSGLPSLFGLRQRENNLSQVHAGNVITPAKTTRGLAGFSSLMSLAQDNESSRNVSVTDAQNIVGANQSAININAPISLTMKDGSKKEVQKLERKLANFINTLEQRITRIHQNGRVRA